MKKTCFFLGVFILLANNLQSQSPVLTRGPYLNIALQNSIVLRWRTDIATDSKVSCGSTPSQLTAAFTDNTVTTEHIITVTGLTANTGYYYSIGSTSQILQGDVNNYFKTLPVSGSKQKTRSLAMGDMGTNFAVQKNVRDAWLTFNGSNYTDGWLLMGDNAYVNGTDAEYQSNFFDVYQGSLTKTMCCGLRRVIMIMPILPPGR